MHPEAATAEHLPAVAALRVALLEETGSTLDPPTRASLLASNLAFFQRVHPSPLWQTWIVAIDGAVVATGTLVVLERPPYPGNPVGRDAYLLNMYTRPAYRGRGAAAAIVEAARRWAADQGVGKLILHATEAGRPVYEAAGFEPSQAYMELRLPPPSMPGAAAGR